MGVAAWLLLCRERLDRERTYSIAFGTDAPFHFADPAGEPAGLAVDLVKEAARRAGIKLQWVRNQRGLNNDLWVLQTVREGREATTYFSDPFLQSYTWFVVSSTSDARRAGDLRRSRVAFVDYAIHRENLARLVPGARLAPVPTSRAAIELVRRGEADAAYVNEYAVLPILLEGGVPQALRIIASGAPKSLMALSSRRGFAPVADAIRQEMEAMVDDGTVANAISRWGWFPNLTADMVGDLVKAQRRMRYQQLGLAGLSLLLATGWWLALRSRRQAIQLARARSILHEKETWLHQLMEQAGDGVEVFDAAGRLVAVNSSACRQLGYTRAELLAIGLGEIDPAMPREEFDRLFGSLVNGAPRTLETVRRRKDGSTFPVEVSIAVFTVADLPRALVLTRDISERKLLDAKLVHAQKMQAIGQLAGGIAHDFNNVLAAIMLNLEFLQQRPDLSPALRDVVGESIAGARRAAGLTRQLLIFSRHSGMELTVVDLNEVVANLLRMLTRLVGESYVLAFERSAPPVRVKADGGMLEQVVMNLVLNARDAMAAGGRILLTTARVEFSADAASAHPQRRPGNFACLAVADTGSGIAADVLPRIFEPFFSTKAPGCGTGLGLATVEGIVARHEGWIEIETAVGEGTTFRVYFPRAAGADVAAAVAPAPLEPDRQQTVLVVEDEAIVRAILGRSLRALGYQVIDAANGPEALAAWARERRTITLLLTDLSLPGGISGLELAQRLRGDQPDLPIVLSSGYHQEIAEGRESPEPAGVVHLPKPFDISELGRAVRKALHAR
jgi:two-component system cell cycle sensor histidine kinase/response regulator CckA